MNNLAHYDRHGMIKEEKFIDDSFLWWMCFAVCFFSLNQCRVASLIKFDETIYFEIFGKGI